MTYISLNRNGSTVAFDIPVSIETYSQITNIPVSDITEISSLEYDTIKSEMSIRKELRSLDLQAIRPLRSIILGVGTDEDRDKLTLLENKAIELRNEYSSLRE